jgi:hypothetical protein
VNNAHHFSVEERKCKRIIDFRIFFIHSRSFASFLMKNEWKKAQ